MKILYNWVKEFVALTISPGEAAERLVSPQHSDWLGRFGG